VTANKLPYRYLVVLCLAILGFSLCFLFTRIFISIWWIDEPLHFAGGLWVALTIFTICYNGMYEKIAKSRRVYLIIAGALLGLLAGSVYEVFEIHAGLTHWPKDLGEDIHDLFFDSLGGAVGAIVFYGSLLKTWADKQNKAALILSAVLAVLAFSTVFFFELPYDHNYLRWTICVVSIYLMSNLNRERDKKWIGTMFIMALVFNPLEKIILPPIAWPFIDLIAAGLFIYFAYSFSHKETSG
jgi:glycopeptide antibiotics resistance protein